MMVLSISLSVGCKCLIRRTFLLLCTGPADFITRFLALFLFPSSQICDHKTVRCNLVKSRAHRPRHSVKPNHLALRGNRIPLELPECSLAFEVTVGRILYKFSSIPSVHGLNVGENLADSLPSMFSLMTRTWLMYEEICWISRPITDPMARVTRALGEFDICNNPFASFSPFVSSLQLLR